MKIINWMKERLNMRKNDDLGNIAKDRERWKKIGQRLKDNQQMPMA